MAESEELPLTVTEVEYRLAMPEPHTHLLQVEVRVPPEGGPVHLVMPSWTPGSYLLREFARNVQDFQAHDATGAPLPWRKLDKNTWQVDAADGPVRVRYRVYANELTVRTSHLDATHAAVVGASVFMLVPGRENQPLALEVDPPEGWRVTTSLAAESTTRFRAASYDELADSPLEIGTHQLLEWDEAGIPHRFAIWGGGGYDADRLVADTRRIIAATRELFGGLPYASYTFILHLVPEGRGGLEHASSCSLQAPRDAFTGEAYESLLALVAHEFFHVWNGKRIRPAPLEPFDYTRENYTRNLWVVEGLTTYYTDRVLLRAGLMTRERYLARLAESIGRLQALPGRHHQSLEESSFDAWIKFYRPDAHTPNSQVSYYHKGALVALLLDLEIRDATADARSLDDLVRLLWERFGAPGTGFPEEGREGIQALAEEVAGRSLEAFFDAYVRGTEEIDFDAALHGVGLRLARKAAGRGDGPGARAAEAPVLEHRLGIRAREQEGRIRITHVLAGTPAHAAGVNAGDEIVALDSIRARMPELAKLLKGRPTGDQVALSVFRRDELLTIRVPLGPEPPPPLRLAPLADPDERQRSRLDAWLLADPEAAPPG